MVRLEAVNDNESILESYTLPWTVVISRLNLNLIKKIPCISHLKMRYPKDLTFKRFNLDLTALIGNYSTLEDLEDVYISEGLKPLPLFLFIDIINSEMSKKTDILAKANINNPNPNIFWLKEGRKRFFIILVADKANWHFFIPNKKQLLPECCIICLDK